MTFDHISIGPDGRPCALAPEDAAMLSVLCASVTELLKNLAQRAEEPKNQEYLVAWSLCGDPKCKVTYPHDPKWITTRYPVSERFLELLGQSASKNAVFTQRDRCIFFTIKEAT
jgi:hypothetical protein